MNTQLAGMARKLVVLAWGAAMAVAPSAFAAEVLHQQSPVAGGDGFFANVNTPQQQADDFTLGGSVSLQSITWWGGYAGNADTADDLFLVRIYASVDGTGVLLHEFDSVTASRSDTALDNVSGDDVFEYEFPLPAPLAVGAGTHYLFVQNLGSSDWFWQQGDPAGGTQWFRAADGEDWTPSTAGNLSFRLDGTRVVPEPATLGLLLLAGTGLLSVRGRRPG